MGLLVESENELWVKSGANEWANKRIRFWQPQIIRRLLQSSEEIGNNNLFVQWFLECCVMNFN